MMCVSELVTTTQLLTRNFKQPKTTPNTLSVHKQSQQQSPPIVFIDDLLFANLVKSMRWFVLDTVLLFRITKGYVHISGFIKLVITTSSRLSYI